MSKLTQQKCVACEGVVRPLVGDILQKHLDQIDNWQVIDNDYKIQKEFEFKDFKQAVGFINQVADLAEKEGHHPNILIHDWNKVSITLYTHAINGLFINDFIIAAKIDELLKK